MAGINESGTITLRIMAQDLASGSVGKFITNMDKLAKQGGLVGSVMQGVGQSIGQMINPIALTTKAFDMMAQGAGMVADGLIGLGQAYKEDQAEQAQLNNTLAKNIDGWTNYADAIDEAIAAGQRLGFSDSEQRQGLGRLVTATHDATRAIQFSRLSMDIARQRNIKYETAVAAVTKAAQGQYKGLKSLGYQIDLTAGSTEALAQVTKQVADSAETWAQTDQGKLAARLIAVTEAAENNGKAFERLDSIQKDIAISGLEAGNTAVMYMGILTDFLGISKEANGATIEQAQSWENLGRAMQEVGYSYDRTAELIKKDYGTVARAHNRTLNHLTGSMDEFLGPWREKWRDAAEWAKDPFRPAKFERWLEHRARNAIRNAKQAAEDGKPGVSARWRAIAAAMRSPVITAVGEIKTSIAEVIRAMQVIDSVRASLGGFRRNGSTGLNPDAQIGPTGSAGLLSSGGSPGRGGGALVHVTVIGSMSEADGQRFAQTVTPHIQRELARQGR